MKVSWQYIEDLKINIYKSLHLFSQKDAVLTLTFYFKIEHL